MAMNEEKGNVRDPMLETAYRDVESLRDKLQQGTERYFRFLSLFYGLRWQPKATGWSLGDLGINLGR